jgi:hypothetical protein
VPLFNGELNPQVDVEDRGWRDLSLSLDPWAGQEIELWFSTHVKKPDGEVQGAAAFGEPRIVAREGSGDALPDPTR